MPATKYPIERGVPFPAKARRTKYPLADLALGESFMVEPKRGESISRTQTRVCCAVALFRHAVSTRKKFSTRIVDDAVRCWRIR